jgi:protein TonB
MTRTVALSEFMPYGAPELQGVARPYLARALLLSTAFSIIVFAAAGLLRSVLPAAIVQPPPVIVIIGPPPEPSSLDAIRPPQPVAPAALEHVTAGIAVPVPDAQAAPEATIATTEDLRAAHPGVGTGDQPIVVQPPEPERLPSPDEYVYSDELPVPVRSVSPEYPSIAREAGVTGVVLVRLLVGRDGHVLDVKVDPKHSIPMLDEAALQAARQWVFTPAYANKQPVAVWVAVPFNFRLQ